MRRLVLRVLVAVALVASGWGVAQARRQGPDFEIAVSAPAGLTTITCVKDARSSGSNGRRAYRFWHPVSVHVRVRPLYNDRLQVRSGGRLDARSDRPRGCRSVHAHPSASCPPDAAGLNRTGVLGDLILSGGWGLWDVRVGFRQSLVYGVEPICAMLAIARRRIAAIAPTRLILHVGAPARDAMTRDRRDQTVYKAHHQVDGPRAGVVRGRAGTTAARASQPGPPPALTSAVWYVYPVCIYMETP